jgi:GTP-binding protein
MIQKPTSTPPRVVEASFAAAAGPGQTLLAPSLPEIAFAGRSNVGKSTLMNALMERKNLVRTSSTPGCTRTVNMFHCRCSDGLELYLVDLPGFGFAKRSKVERRSWGPLLGGYFHERPSLRALVLLVDVRRGVEGEEQDLIEFMAQKAGTDRPVVPVFLVATKTDKLGAAQRKPAVARVGNAGVPVLGVSGETGDGVETLWKRLRKAVGVSGQPTEATPEAAAAPLDAGHPTQTAAPATPAEGA